MSDAAPGHNNPPNSDDPLWTGDDNDGEEPQRPHDVNGIAGERLLSFVERIERLREEQKSIGDDIREVRKEAKASGFDTKIITWLIRERSMDNDDRDERDTLQDIYKRAIGML